LHSYSVIKFSRLCRSAHQTSVKFVFRVETHGVKDRLENQPSVQRPEGVSRIGATAQALALQPIVERVCMFFGVRTFRRKAKADPILVGRTAESCQDFADAVSVY
jgi:hypothetical protein